MLFLLLSRRLGSRVDGRLVVAAGVLLTMIGIVPFAVAGATGGQALLLAAQFVQGVGIGAVTLPVMTLAFASLTPAETPRGSAAFSVVQRVGAPFGVTVIAVILQTQLRGGAGLAAAFGTTFWWVFGLSAVPLLLAFLIPATKPFPKIPDKSPDSKRRPR